MAIIFKTQYLQNVMGSPEPILYVDTINKDSYVAEMYNQCVKHIREKTNILTSIDDHKEFKREIFSAKDENEIYYKKPDGFWIISDEKNRIITLYKRITYRGMFYDSAYVMKIFTLTCKETPKIVPQIFKKSTLFESFTKELSEKVSIYRDRTDALKKIN